MKFTKMHALGNDFVIIDCINQSFHPTTTLICQWADRHTGIGFDQLLLVEPSVKPNVDFFYRIFNADGTESGQCGNGARCFARFVYEQGLTTKKDLVIATSTSCMSVRLQDTDLVTVNMGVPRLEPKKIPFIATQQAMHYELVVGTYLFNVGVVSLGNPHCIVPVPHVDEAPIATVGPQIAQHSRFPEGTNVEFLEIIDRSHIRLRIYERGVGETLACGSGAAAAVVYGHNQGLLNNDVTVTLRGGNLTVSWEGIDTPLWLTGPAIKVFDGTVST